MLKTLLHDSEASSDITSISETPIEHFTPMANFWIERLPFGVKISCGTRFTVSSTDAREILIEPRTEDTEPTIPGPGWEELPEENR